MEIKCFGDSNVKKHLDVLYSGILSKCQFILTYNFDELKENLFVITGKEDYIIIHILTNDVKYICYNQSWKSVSERKNDLISLAHDFVNRIKQLIVEYPDMKIFINMVLPRFDGKDLLGMYSVSRGNEIINAELSTLLLDAENVILMKNDDMEKSDFHFDNVHLLDSSFQKMCTKWRKEIGK